MFCVFLFFLSIYVQELPELELNDLNSQHNHLLRLPSSLNFIQAEVTGAFTASQTMASMYLCHVANFYYHHTSSPFWKNELLPCITKITISRVRFLREMLVYLWHLHFAINKWFSGEIFEGTYLTTSASNPWSLSQSSLPMSIISLHIKPKAALSSACMFLIVSSTPLCSGLDCSSLLHNNGPKKKRISNFKKIKGNWWTTDSFLSSNMPSFKPLTSIHFHITSIHIFLSHP